MTNQQLLALADKHSGPGSNPAARELADAIRETLSGSDTRTLMLAALGAIHDRFMDCDPASVRGIFCLAMKDAVEAVKNC